jgi:hypothetical protein
MIAHDMDVVHSYGGHTVIAAVRGPTRWLEDSLSELFMTGKKVIIYLVENKEQEEDCYKDKVYPMTKLNRPCF